MKCNCCGNVLWVEQTTNGAMVMVRKCNPERTETGIEMDTEQIKELIATLEIFVK